MRQYPNIGFRIPQELKDKLNKDARDSGMTLSKYILYIIQKHYRS